MNISPADAVAIFRAWVWPCARRDSVIVELVPVPAVDHQHVEGRVLWDAQRRAWRIWANSNTDGARVLRILIHELAHVALGHADPADALPPAVMGLMPAAMRRGLPYTLPDAAALAREVAAEAWTDATFAFWEQALGGGPR